ncbi:MAG: Rrf2 family transcriptional regulator [Hyphomicrobium sp.]|nr:Rrf2 family transcriptional regulator [Hyphomicrobium sp.]
MKINKVTSHALRLLVACARADGALRKVADLATDLGLTQQNALKIAHLLSRAGLVEAERGRYGGVRLAAAPDDIRVGDVVVAMERLPIGGAGRGRGRADGEAMFDEAFEAFVAVLNQTTIADMAAAKPRKSKDGAARSRTKAAVSGGSRRMTKSQRPIGSARS